MGAKAWMVVYSNGNAGDTLRRKPTLDRVRSIELAGQLFPTSNLVGLEDVDLSLTDPRGRKVYVGCYDDVSIVAAKEFGIDHPSKIKSSFLDQRYGNTICLLAAHSVVDWFAYAIWRDGTLVRSLSLAPDSGIMEELGVAQDFEEPFWAGANPVFTEDDGEEAEAYPFVFHPLDLGAEASLAMFGYALEGVTDESQVQPEEFPLLAFKRKRKWKFW
jgi:hypothetical protein